MSFSPDGQRLVTTSGDGTVKVWNAVTGQELVTLTGHTGPVFCVAISPDGRRMATGSSDRTVRVWDVRPVQAPLALRGHTGPVLGVAYSPDGRHLATGSADKTVRVWGAGTGRELLPPKEHPGNVNSVAFSPERGWDDEGLGPANSARDCGSECREVLTPGDERLEIKLLRRELEERLPGALGRWDHE